MNKLPFLFLLTFTVVASASASSDVYYDYVHGLMAERSGDLKTALREYQKVVEQDPQALEVFKDLAQLNLRTGHTDDALHAAERVKDLAPDDPDSHLFLGNVYVARGDLAKAVQEFEKTLQLDPNNLRALENLGNYYSAFNIPRALEYYHRYLIIEPQDAEVQFQVGFLHEKNNNTSEAITAFHRAIDLDPDEIAPHLALAELYEAQKSTAAAVSEYQHCVRLDPHNPAFQARLGHLYFEDKHWDDAGIAFENARVMDPHDASIYYWLARVAEEHHQWPDAEKYSQKAYELSHDAQFLPLLAYYLTIEGKPQQAIDWLEKALKGDATNANVMLFLGMDYLDLDKPKKALPILEKGAALQPKDTQLQFQLGVAYDRLGQFDQAVAQFEKVLTLDPNNAAAMNYLGYSFADRNVRLPEAESLLRQAVKLDPQNGAYLDSLGWVRFKQGNYPEAISFLGQAVQYSKDSLIYEHLGDAYSADKKSDLALGAWTKALELSSNNPELQKKIQEASQTVKTGSDQRKYLKYIEGNFRQVSDLRGTAIVRGRWQNQSFKTRGGLYYLKPDRLLLAMGTPRGPEVRVSVKDQKVTILPDEAAQMWRGFSLERLKWLPSFFSGELLAALDDPSVPVQTDGALLHYQGKGEEAWVDPARGVLTRYIRDNPEGGRDEMNVKSYDLVEGIWLPKEIQINNPHEGWKATLTFSQWQINEPQTAHAYETLLSSASDGKSPTP